jgi:hypothetical protein
MLVFRDTHPQSSLPTLAGEGGKVQVTKVYISSQVGNLQRKGTIQDEHGIFTCSQEKGT